MKETTDISKMSLSLKRKDARLQDEKDVVEAWLTTRHGSGDGLDASDKYRFEHLSGNVIRLVEVADYNTGAVIDSDAEILSQIAIKLIQKDEAMRVEDQSGLKVAELNVI